MRRILLALCVFSSPLWAGLEIDRRITAGTEGDGQRMLLRESYDGKKQRVDLLDADGKKTTGRLSLFDEGKGEIYVFDEHEKKFLVTPLRGLATPKRKVAKATATTFEKIGSGKVGSWSCTRYRVTRDGKRLGEACTVPLPALGLSAKDLGAYGRVNEQDWAPGGDGNDSRWTLETSHGFPVEVVAESGPGLPASHVEVLAVRKVAFTADHFAMPKNYQRAETPALPGSVVAPPPHATPARP